VGEFMLKLNFGKGALSLRLDFEMEKYVSWEVVKDPIDRGILLPKEALYHVLRHLKA